MRHSRHVYHANTQRETFSPGTDTMFGRVSRLFAMSADMKVTSHTGIGQFQTIHETTRSLTAVTPVFLEMALSYLGGMLPVYPLTRAAS